MTVRTLGRWLAVLLIAMVWPALPAGAKVPPAATLEMEPVSDDPEQLACRFTESQIALLEKLNRSDQGHLVTLRKIVVPRHWDRDEVTYSPLPERYAPARKYGKVIVVYKPAQVFGAYRGGRLERWGPVSTGARNSRTPAGSFHLNWKSKGHRSTVNRNWFLPWSFNFHNERGHSFHEYELPGKPASHGCIRMLGRDARWLFEWGEEWSLGPRGWTVEQQGTRVLIVGEYDHDQEPLWRSSAYLAAGGALDLHDDRLEVTLAEAFLAEEKPEDAGD